MASVRIHINKQNMKTKKKTSAKKETMKSFIKDIDFKMLKKQKAVLLEMIEEVDNVPQLKALEGILALIKSIQDIAVDQFKVKEEDVFQTSNEE
jgi:hypothetical protein